jgi:8-oxo-dGTP diphosphatase
LWEFPGGKVERGEDPRIALVREIAEELSATVVVRDEIGDVPWVISDEYVLRLFTAAVESGALQVGSDHDELRWLALADLDTVEWLPSDRLALDAVRAALDPE